MADLLGENAFFTTLYFTDIPINKEDGGEYRHGTRALAKYISKLFGESESKIIESRGVERAILPKKTQTYDNGIESTIIPKAYTCGDRVVIAVDEELKDQRALSTHEPMALADLTKYSSEKRRALCDTIYNACLNAKCTIDTSYEKYLCDINAFETQEDKDIIIDELVAGGNVDMHRDSKTEGIDVACSLLSSTGTDHIDNISAIYKNGVRIPLRCSSTKTNPNNRVITILTTSRGASSAAGLIKKEYLIQTE